MPVQCRFVANSCWRVFPPQGGLFVEALRWLSSNGEMPSSFLSFSLFALLQTLPSVEPKFRLFQVSLFARRFAVWNKFSGANFCFLLFVVVVCFSVVFCLGFCIRMWCVAPETVLRNIFPMSGLLFLGSLLGINFRERTFAFCCLFWSCVFLWCFAEVFVLGCGASLQKLF